MKFDLKLSAISERIDRDFRKHNGGTYSLTGIDTPTTGYMVSRPNGNVIPLVNITHFDISRFIAGNAGNLLRYYDEFLGIWVSDGKVYLDVSVHFHGINNALSAGEKWEQLAIWDCEKGKAIDVSTHQYV